MKSTILLGTLKKSGLSHTATLCEFLAARMERAGIQSEKIKLANYETPPGTYSNMGPGDHWPELLEGMLASSGIVRPRTQSRPREELLRMYESEQAEATEKMLQQLAAYVRE